jgi:hypothetical protein
LSGFFHFRELKGEQIYKIPVMRITNEQKNELSLKAKEAGLNRTDFQTSGSHHEFLIKYKYEYFSFSITKVSASDKYKLGVTTVKNKNGYIVECIWKNVVEHFTKWANELAKELNTPTGWETFDNEDFLNLNISDLNNHFSESEKVLVRNTLIELKEKIKLLELGEEKLDIITKKLDQLSEDVDHLSKFDWKSLFIGSIANLLMALAIPPEAAGMIWHFIKSLFFTMALKQP